MSTDTINANGALIDQKDAVKSYLSSLLDIPSATGKKPDTNASNPKQGHIPNWAQNGFRALNFRSAGLQLYLPVSFVRGVKNIGGRIDNTEGASEWIKGTITSKGKKICVLETELLVSAHSKRTVNYQHPDANSYVVLLGDGNFGLVCDTIGHVKQLSITDVHWRDSTTNHRWIAGMMKNEVAALIDARRLALAVSMQGALV